jgi:short-subunit dehydrogenase involved in D-alanine esterification of teichoic acids
MRGGGLAQELAQVGNEVDVSERLKEMARQAKDGMPRQTAAVAQMPPRKQTII